MKQPKYKIDSPVKVQVLNIITVGTIIKQEIHINKCGTAIKYIVDFGIDTVDPWEEDLDFVQGQPLGRLK